MLPFCFFHSWWMFRNPDPWSFDLLSEILIRDPAQCHRVTKPQLQWFSFSERRSEGGSLPERLLLPVSCPPWRKEGCATRFVPPWRKDGRATCCVPTEGWSLIPSFIVCVLTHVKVFCLPYWIPWWPVVPSSPGCCRNFIVRRLWMNYELWYHHQDCGFKQFVVINDKSPGLEFGSWFLIN